MPLQFKAEIMAANRSIPTPLDTMNTMNPIGFSTELTKTTNLWKAATMQKDQSNTDHNAQSSAPAPVHQNFSPHEQVEHLFKNANELNEQLVQMLTKARQCGKYLNGAKPIVKSQGGFWEGYVKKHFNGSWRNAQNYMLIDNRWSDLQPVLAKHPDLSIDGALRYLRTGLGPKRFDKGDFTADKILADVFRQDRKQWSREEKELLRLNPEAYREKMAELRSELRREREGFTKNEIRTNNN